MPAKIRSRTGGTTEGAGKTGVGKVTDRISNGEAKYGSYFDYKPTKMDSAPSPYSADVVDSSRRVTQRPEDETRAAAETKGK